MPDPKRLDLARWTPAGFETIPPEDPRARDRLHEALNDGGPVGARLFRCRRLFLARVRDGVVEATANVFPAHLPGLMYRDIIARVGVLATAPGWQEGDVVAVVGTDREGGAS